MNRMLSMYNSSLKLPLGRRFFSWMVCFNAPYFSTIRPLFLELRPGFGSIYMKKRRGVLNHLKTVHAIAMCNLCELAGGSTVEVTLPPEIRWIPRGMTVQYLRMAKTDLTARCTVDIRNSDLGEKLPVTVDIHDTNGEKVFTAVIDMHLSERKPK